ncbi:HAD family hydrolase [Nocardioides marmoraquaticus]
MAVVSSYAGRLVVGFDLDMTLIDTVAGFVATLDALAADLGIELPSAELSANLGPPLDHVLAGHVSEGQMAHAITRFRALYPETAITPTAALPGAVEALVAVRRHGGRTVLVTGKYTPNAHLHVDHLGLDVDVVEGGVWGGGKGEVLRRHEATLYVGDHVHDVEGARAAGVPSVSVLSGGCTEAELREAGTDVVLPDLHAFPGWLEGWLASAG